MSAFPGLTGRSCHPSASGRLLSVLLVCSLLLSGRLSHPLQEEEVTGEPAAGDSDDVAIQKYLLSMMGLSHVPRPPPEGKVVPEYVRYLYQELSSQDALPHRTYNQEKKKVTSKIFAIGATSSNLSREGLNLQFPVPTNYDPEGLDVLTRVELVLVRRGEEDSRSNPSSLLKIQLHSGNASVASMRKNKRVVSTYGLWDIGIVTDLVTSQPVVDDDVARKTIDLTLRDVRRVPLQREYYVNVEDPYVRPELIFYYNIYDDVMNHVLPPDSVDDVRERHRRSALDKNGLTTDDNYMVKAEHSGPTIPTPRVVQAPATDSDAAKPPAPSNAIPTARAHADDHVHGDEMCQLHDWYVDFSEMGWDSWIVSPIGYWANYCFGQCRAPLLRHSLNVTNHAYFKAMYRTHLGLHNTKHIMPATCAPISLSMVSLIYVSDTGHHVLTNLPEMKAEHCGCI